MVTSGDQDAGGFWHMTKAQLKTIIDAFSQIAWPAPAEATDRLLEQLGWERVRLRVARMGVLARNDAASIGLADSEDGEDTRFDTLRFLVADVVKGPDAVRVLEMYRTMVGWVSEIVGPAAANREPSPHPDAGPDFPITWWDLPSGGGVQLYYINGVTMELMSQKAAEGERFDREHPEYGSH